MTGASGFLGCKVLSGLIDENVAVMGIDPEPEGQVPSSTESFRGRGCVFIRADVTNSLKEMQTFLDPVSVDKRCIFHFAGLADVSECRRNPRAAYDTNVNLTHRILESCRKMDGATIIYPSTGLVYGDNLTQPAVEENQTFADSIYTGMKLAAEKIIQAYASGGFCRCIITRLGNVYDIDSDGKTVIGRILSQVRRKMPLHVDYDSPVRDFIYSADVVEALCRLADISPLHNQLTVNVSTGVGYSIGKVVKIASELSGLPVRKSLKQHSNEAPHSELILSNRRLAGITGWKPEISLAEGLSGCMAISKPAVNDSHKLNHRQ